MSIPSFQGVFPCDGFIIAYPAGGFHRLGLHFGAVAYVFERLGVACKGGTFSVFYPGHAGGAAPPFCVSEARPARHGNQFSSLWHWMLVSLPLWQRQSFTLMDQRLCLWNSPGPSRALDPLFGRGVSCPNQPCETGRGRPVFGKRLAARWVSKNVTEIDFRGPAGCPYCANLRNVLE